MCRPMLLPHSDAVDIRFLLVAAVTAVPPGNVQFQYRLAKGIPAPASMSEL